MINGIVFDKDGTLFEFRATWEAWTESFLLRGTGGDRDRARLIGAEVGFDLAARQFTKNSIIIAGTMEEVAEALAQHMPEVPDLLEMLNDEASQAPQIEAVPLVPFFEVLRKRGLKLGVATNDSVDPAVAHLSRAGVLASFDFIAGYDSGHGGKPAPGQLLAFCRQTGLDPKDCAMVGDSLHDLFAGRAAGMHTIGVLTGMADKGDLAPHADVVLPDIGHIPSYLETLTLP